jgi:hypothetical protein
MDIKGRGRFARAIARIARTLEEEGVTAWLGGQWAQVALDPNHKGDSSQAIFYTHAVDAADVRGILEDLGYDVVDLTATAFATVRGSWRINWVLLWHDEAGRVVNYDEYDIPRAWPEGAFPAEPRGFLHDTALKVVDPAAQVLSSKMDADERPYARRKNDAARAKAIIHDRM